MSLNGNWLILVDIQDQLGCRRRRWLTPQDGCHGLGITPQTGKMVSYRTQESDDQRLQTVVD
jgi:hypothetical protein